MENISQNSSAGIYKPKEIIKRAAIMAIIIGSALSLSGQHTALFGPAEIKILPMILAFLTPFVIVIISQVLGIREARKVKSPNIKKYQSFMRTLFSHGILNRSIALGLVAGGINTAIVASANLAAGQGLNHLPITLIVQALTLPIIFGAISQTLSFRRTIGQFT